MNNPTILKLQPLERESIARGIPILGSAKGAWLAQKIHEVKPKRIFELGTANGYSGCILGSTGAELTTIEVNAIIAEEARENFKKYGINANVLVGDAVQIAKQLSNETESQGNFDIIFIDFAKNKYFEVLDYAIALVRKGGLIIADNITMDGCRDYQQAVLHHTLLKTELIPIKDGLSSSTKL